MKFHNNGTFITNNTSQAHEIHTLGQFKDDQFQGHDHNYYYPQFDTDCDQASRRPRYTGSATLKTTDIVEKSDYGTPRYGTTTHGKQMGVTYLIKVL